MRDCATEAEARRALHAATPASASPLACSASSLEASPRPSRSCLRFERFAATSASTQASSARLTAAVASRRGVSSSALASTMRAASQRRRIHLGEQLSGRHVRAAVDEQLAQHRARHRVGGRGGRDADDAAVRLDAAERRHSACRCRGSSPKRRLAPAERPRASKATATRRRQRPPRVGRARSRCCTSLPPFVLALRPRASTQPSCGDQPCSSIASRAAW